MGQTQLMCYRDCRQPTENRQQQAQRVLEKWYNKQWGRVAERYYQCDSKTLPSGLAAFNTATLTSVRNIPEEHQQLVVNMKLMNYQFRDEWFPQVDTSIGFDRSPEKSNVVWRRAKQLYPTAVLDSKERVSYEVCSNLSTRMTKLYTVFSLLSEFREVMNRMLNWPLTEEGIFGVTFFINGVKEEVIIDDYLPTVNGRYMFGEPPVKDQLWPLLVEKALAKVVGSYYNIDNFSIQELFEQITGIPADTTGTDIEYNHSSTNSPSAKPRRNQTKSLLLLLKNETGSHHKLPTKSTSSLAQSGTSQECQDEFIHLMRMPGYEISSLQIHCNKREESLYYRFRMSEAARVSLRVNQLLPRHFEEHLKGVYNFGEVMLELARFDECSNGLDKLYQGGSLRQQKTYLEDRQFIDLIQGEYFLHLRICQEVHPQFQPPYSLVVYAPGSIAIRPILSSNKAEQLKNTMLKQQYHRLLEDVMPSARGRSISTKTVCTKRRVLLMISNLEQTSRRMKMTLLNRGLFFEDREQQSELILQVGGRSEHLVSLLLRDPRVKLDNRQPCYQIRVIP